MIMIELEVFFTKRPPASTSAFSTSPSLVLMTCGQLQNTVHTKMRENLKLKELRKVFSCHQRKDVQS